MFCDYFVFVTLYETGEVSLRVLSANSFHAKADKETPSKNCTREGYSNAARLFFHIQPILSLNCDVVVAFAVAVVVFLEEG